MLRVVFQAAFLAGLAVLLGLAARSVLQAFARQGVTLDFSFLLQEAGTSLQIDSTLSASLWPPHFALVPYDYTVNFLQTIIGGLFNTVRISFVAITVTTVSGVLLGVSRLSTNWLVSRLSLAYVEVFRNTPLLVQLFFWYSVILINAQPGTFLGGLLALSPRGAAVPLVEWRAAAGLWVLWAGGVAALARLGHVARGAEGRWRTPLLAWTMGVPAILIVLGLAPASITLAANSDVALSGFVLSPEYTGLLVGLAAYHAAFIAEIVRGGIQSIHRGQFEAAMALGLTYGQMMRLVILPQVLRIVIPPLGNQYLNLTKNSSLAIAIGYVDILVVANNANNLTGRGFEAFTIVTLTYLLVSLGIAGLLGLVNRRLDARTAG